MLERVIIVSQLVPIQGRHSIEDNNMTDETQDNGRKLFADIQPTDELTKHEVGMI